MEAPELFDFFDYATGEFDVVKFSFTEEEYENRNRDVPDAVKVVKRPLKRRKSYVRRDPMSSFWWQDYVIDADHTWRDLFHRNWKQFRYRFSHNFDSVHEIVANKQEKEHYFCKNTTDNSGKQSSPCSRVRYTRYSPIRDIRYTRFTV